MDPSIERSPSFLWNSHGTGFREPWTVKFAAAHDVQPRFVVTGPLSRLAKGTRVLMTILDAATGDRKSVWTCTVDDHAFQAPKWPVLLGEALELEVVPATGTMKDCRVQLILAIFEAHGDAPSEIRDRPVVVRSKPPAVASKKKKGPAPLTRHGMGGSRSSSPEGSSSSASLAAPDPVAPPLARKRRAEEGLPPRAAAAPPPPGLRAPRAGGSALLGAATLPTDCLDGHIGSAGGLPPLPSDYALGIIPGLESPFEPDGGAAAAPVRLSPSYPRPDDLDSLLGDLDDFVTTATTMNPLPPSSPPPRR